METVRAAKTMDENAAPLCEDLLVLVSGSIAAFNVPAILHCLKVRGVARHLTIALSQSAQEFVSETSLSVLCGRPCITDVLSAARIGRAEHVEVARRCAFAVVVPATAQTIASVAHGLCGETIPLILSVFERPVLFIPAVHPAAFRSRAFQRNLTTLREDGCYIIEPVQGYSISEQAPGTGVGAMAAPEVVAFAIESWIRERIADQARNRGTGG